MFVAAALDCSGSWLIHNDTLIWHVIHHQNQNFKKSSNLQHSWSSLIYWQCCGYFGHVMLWLRVRVKLKSCPNFPCYILSWPEFKDESTFTALMALAILFKVLWWFQWCGNVAEIEMLPEFLVLYTARTGILRQVRISNIQGHSYFIACAMARLMVVAQMVAKVVVELPLKSHLSYTTRTGISKWVWICSIHCHSYFIIFKLGLHLQMLRCDWPAIFNTGASFWGLQCDWLIDSGDHRMCPLFKHPAFWLAVGLLLLEQLTVP